MPIRFRCVYCDKLLGIARRKAGSVVSCPQCAEKLIVPTPDPNDTAGAAEDDARGTDEEEALAGSAGAPPKLFERSDFDAMLGMEPTFRTSEPDPAQPPLPVTYRSPPPAPAPIPQPYSAPAPLPSAPAKLPRSDPPRLPRGLYISPTKATWFSVIAVVGLALAFGAGLILGRMMK